jgi:F-type H+-transporting ATPase subunit b
MSTEKKSSSGSVFLAFIVGVILMVGGTYMSLNVHIGFFEDLGKQGILIDPGKTVAVIGVFLILFPIIKTFYLNPLSDAINQRNSDLERTFAEAENLRTQMTQMKTDYEQRLTATEAQAREQIQAQIKEAQDLRTQLMHEAAAKAEEMVKKAQEEIEGEKRKVIGELRLEVVNLTLSATERILGENMNNERNRKLVEDFINTVEAPA